MDRSTEEAVCSLQAQVHVQGLALRALAATHPDPTALLAAWRNLLADAEAGPISVRERASAYLDELCRIRAEAWTAELVGLVASARRGQDYDRRWWRRPVATA